MGGSWSKVEFIRQAFVLMTERAVSAIDKRTDAEINRQLRLEPRGHSLPSGPLHSMFYKRGEALEGMLGSRARINITRHP